MVYLATSDEWQRQSSRLLQAQPTTTRVTTKYKIPNLHSPRYNKPKKRKRDADTTGEDKDAPRVPRGTLTLKTHDSVSGVVLKFKTDRAAEVGRLIGSLGRLGRNMAALPEKVEDVTMDDAPLAAEQAAEPSEAAAPAAAPQVPESKPQAGGTGGGTGGGKKKKKNKK